ncbi:MAG: small basic protein [Verrucomicrobiales bacterium]
MSQHRSLKLSKSVGAKRNVLKRFERVKLLMKRGEYTAESNPVGLPKTTPEV